MSSKEILLLPRQRPCCKIINDYVAGNNGFVPFARYYCLCWLILEEDKINGLWSRKLMHIVAKLLCVGSVLLTSVCYPFISTAQSANTEFKSKFTCRSAC